mmetsp:Transcript_12663/g.26865  ORF Transcript_12663/g.26865 Transcript_12663/m.26865 type:complete len:99 (-) Transcript_12663:334-630(-)
MQRLAGLQEKIGHQHGYLLLKLLKYVNMAVVKELDSHLLQGIMSLCSNAKELLAAKGVKKKKCCCIVKIFTKEKKGGRARSMLRLHAQSTPPTSRSSI